MRRALILTGMAAFLAMGAAAARADDYVLTIKDHRFTPTEINIPANKRVQITVVNDDATPEEFESNELNREKVVVGKGTITVLLGPLDAGRYPFFGDFHQETAQGVLVVK